MWKLQMKNRLLFSLESYDHLVVFYWVVHKWGAWVVIIYHIVLEVVNRLRLYIILAGGPGFSRGVPRTIKYKCAIIAHHERKAGEMLISSIFDKKMHNFHMEQSIKQSEFC